MNESYQNIYGIFISLPLSNGILMFKLMMVTNLTSRSTEAVLKYMIYSFKC